MFLISVFIGMFDTYPGASYLDRVIMKLPPNIKPINYGAEALVPLTKEVIDLLTKENNYGEPYVLYKQDTPNSPNAWVPRGLVNRQDCPEGQQFLSTAPVSKTEAIKPPQTEDQASCIAQSIALMKHSTDHVIESPTGSGKTYMGCAVAGALGQRALIVVTKNDLIKGWKDTLVHLFGVNPNKIGHVQQNQCKYKDCDFVVAMIHSLVCREYDPEFYRYFGITIFDESGSKDTLVTTSRGQIRFEDLVRNRIDCYVLSFNTTFNEYEWKPILAYHEHPPKNPLMRITHEHGYLDFTSEHLFYTDRGWLPVRELVTGDNLYIDLLHSTQYSNSEESEDEHGNMDTGYGVGEWEWECVPVEGQTESRYMGPKTRVLSVTRLPDPDLVYDIEVADNHNFVANGVLVHNCHRLGADYFAQACAKFPTALRLGLSATPKRGDGKEKLFEAHIGPVMVKGSWVPMSPKILVKQTGWKVPLVNQRDDQDGVWKKMPMKVTPGRMMAVSKAIAADKARNSEIAKFVKSAYDAGRTIVVMSDLVEDHIVPLFHFIAQAGVPGEHIGFYHGAVKKTELDHVKNNKRVVLATYAMCSEGTNAPHWDTLVLATPRSNVKQAIGRVIRLVQGKRQPVVLDLVDDNSVLKAFYYSRVKQYFSVGGELVDV
jgi:hypothetical protein